MAPLNESKHTRKGMGKETRTHVAILDNNTLEIYTSLAEYRVGDLTLDQLHGLVQYMSHACLASEEALKRLEREV